jgi:Tfp pilus assembly protein PilX
MKRMLRALEHRFGDRENGFALIMVMGIGLVLLIIVTTAISLSISDLQKSKGDQNFSAAESAAYAGIADYETKLSNNNTYYLYGNTASPFTPANTVKAPPTANPAFSVGTTDSTWASVPGGDGTAFFRYEVDNSKYASTGIIRLRATGRVGTSQRTVIANVKQHGFVDFMYYTKYELQDPAQTNPACVPTYDWQTPHDTTKCNEIQFAAADVINGPVHSNDTIKICGSTFKQSFTSSDPVAPYYETIAGCAAPKFLGGAPTKSATIDPPPSNAQMKQEYRTDLPATVPNPGCLYTGPTNVQLNGDGTMTVISPFTKVTEVSANPLTGDPTVPSVSAAINAKCGTPGTGTGALGSSTGATIPVLDANLMFVQDVPIGTILSPDPNTWVSGVYPSGFTCNSSSTLSGWKFSGLTYPLATETVPTASPAHYSCLKGDVFVKGVMSKTMTITASNYIYVTGDITYANATTDMLGLVGTNAVWVYNPMTSGGTPLLTGSNRTINAAILSILHTFQVQNYNVGSSSRGTLNVFGAIAQTFRGTVATSSGGTIGQGYAKNYNYDSRLQYQAPPKFLSPVSATYGISQLVEVSTPFKADGSYKP